ncbi:MAG: glycosyltransferase family 39 protein [Planctomycetaceae bacterium]|jgi:hypothetical protein|nr:glycosyltransferase family 39 protein [Planctomycetaceae bacterium]
MPTDLTLNRKTTFNLICLLLLAVQTVLLAWSGYIHSPTHLEVFHLPAGLSHLELSRFDLYRVNPPLVRMVAAVPVWLSPHHSNYASYNRDPLIRAEYGVGIDTMHANGKRFIWLITLARWACIPFILLGSWICFLWARQLYGGGAAVVAMLLWVFCPYVISQGSVITPDAHAAALGITAAFLFWKWLKKPTLMLAVVAGLFLGIAELSKFTLLIFYPLGVVTWLLFRVHHRGTVCYPKTVCYQKTTRLREIAMGIVIIVVSVLVINMGYDFEDTLKPLGDYRFQTKLLTGEKTLDDIPAVGGNRFAGTLLANVPVPLPANFLSGIDQQRKDFETGLSSYLCGKWQDGGWWYFHLFALLIKIPLGTWGLVIIATCLTLADLRFRTSWRDEVFLLLPVLTMLVVLSSQTGIGLHSRYSMPLLPFLFIWTSKIVFVFQYRSKLLCNVAVAFLLWSVGSSLYYFPHEIPYCNELVGGSQNAYKYLVKSDSSWGQDLLLLKRWLDVHPEASEIHIAHCGPLDPRLVGLEILLPPVGINGEERFEELPVDKLGPLPGWYAIDVCFLQGGDPLSATNGRGGWIEPSGKPGYDYSYFQKFEITDRIGYTINIYNLSIDEVNTVRAELGLPLIVNQQNR